MFISILGIWPISGGYFILKIFQHSLAERDFYLQNVFRTVQIIRRNSDYVYLYLGIWPTQRRIFTFKIFQHSLAERDLYLQNVFRTVQIIRRNSDYVYFNLGIWPIQRRIFLHLKMFQDSRWKDFN